MSKSKDKFEPVALSAPPPLSDAQREQSARAFFEAMRTRRTVRDYDSRAIPLSVIQYCIQTAGSAPSGANQQPWHFVAISDSKIKRAIRQAAEEEEQKFYDGGGGEAWLAALEPIGTGVSKPHLEDAPWLIVVFAGRWGIGDKGERIKHYYVPESVGIATGFLLAALHQCGLASLTHTPSPMGFLNKICNRPAVEKPTMIIAVGQASENAVVPAAALKKKSLDEILTVL